MRNTWWVLALFALSGIAAADDISCNINSDYDLGITPKSVILTGDNGTPKALVMHNMDKDIQTRVEPRARALKRNARALCEHMQSLDRIGAALDYRLPGGGRLNLLETKVEHRH